MNQDQAKAWLPLIQAVAEGKTIQVNIGTYNQPKWQDTEYFNFACHVEAHRIKPEPKKAWYRVALFRNGTKTAELEPEVRRWSDNPNFIRWLTDKIEYELPEGEA